MTFSVVQPLVILGLSWVCWRILRPRLFPSALRNLPGPDGGSWLSGHLNKMMNTTAWDYHLKTLRQFGATSLVKGVFGSDDIYTFDPKALHHILVKDHNVIWDETDSFVAGNKTFFGEGIFTSLGERHRRQRKMLNPVFSINHMREMVLIFYEVAHKAEQAFSNKVANGPQEIDVMDWMTRLALELIGQSGLGYTFDELTETSQPHRYAQAAKQLIPSQTENTVVIQTILPYITNIGTPKFRRWIVDHFPSKGVKKMRDIVDVLHETSVEIYESKLTAIKKGDEALAAQIGKGKDIISILLKANMKADDDDKLSEEELLGQVTSLTFAATDTTSGALTRTFHLLAQHKDAQAKVREEIRNARKANGGQDIDYDTLVALPYLDAICRETLRLHPPVSALLRVARQDGILPFMTPVRGKDGKMITELEVPKGTIAHISILNANTNPDLWGPDAGEWKPERWLNPLPQALIDARIPGVYSHLMTFLGGGRSCIGFKFSQLEMKVVLVLMLEKFEFSLSDKNIYWQMTGITTPNLDATSTLPTLPLIVGKAK
ncbi:cytochrome P450 [Agrocybe pediades]|nr:cytochrome P450 [Agrocybe pediades]